MREREFYDELSEDYDLMVDWEKRLKDEKGFFKSVFEGNGVRSVLDVACGTGMHAIAFAKWGYLAAGADISPAMIRRARENASREGVEVPFRVAAFGEIGRKFGADFDAVTCLGNSLPHLPDDASLKIALSDMRSVLRDGGILIIQNRNYDRILRERDRFMPINVHQEGDEEVLFLRMLDFCGEERIDFNIITLRKKDGRWSYTVRTTPLRPLRRNTVERSLRDAGFEDVRIYGNYKFEEYDSEGTLDLIAIARK
ncbi:MAG: class I SAM-dependent methyltransferase [bacterium]